MLASVIAAADEKSDARKHFQSGTRLFDLKEYQQAIDEYKASYQLYPSPLLLYDIGQAYRLLGDSKKAIGFYELYLAKDSTGEYRQVAQEEVAKLNLLVAEEARRREAPPQGAAEPPPDAEKRDHATGAAPAPGGQTTALSAAPTPVYKSAAGWAPLASGVAVCIAGAVLLAHAADLDGQVAAAPSVAQIRALQDDAATYRVAGWTVAGIGAAAALAGVVVFAVLAARKSAPSLVLRIAPSNGVGSLVLGGIQW